MLAKSVVAPVDRVKILFQVTNEKFSFRKVRLQALVRRSRFYSHPSRLAD